jgi:uncharacterized membrane protein
MKKSSINLSSSGQKDIKQMSKNISRKILPNEDLNIEKITKATHPTFRIPRSSGQKAADFVTKWAGSWAFIISFGIVMLLWILANTAWLVFGGIWDPYPFILFNFVLSTLAAIQAPIILMSNNRQEQKDRVRAEYDYRVNVKAEKEIRELKTQLSRIEKRLGKKR